MKVFYSYLSDFTDSDFQSLSEHIPKEKRNKLEAVKNQKAKKESILANLYGAIKISIVIPTTPSIPSPIKNFIFTPPTNNNPIIDTTIIIPVPKSGCNIIRPNVKNNTPKIGKTPFFISLILFSLFIKYFDVNIISANLVNSLGCTPKEPIPNQL